MLPSRWNLGGYTILSLLVVENFRLANNICNYTYIGIAHNLTVVNRNCVKFGPQGDAVSVHLESVKTYDIP